MKPKRGFTIWLPDAFSVFITIYMFLYLLLKTFFIEFIGVTLVNEIIHVSGIQFYNTSSVYCIVYSSTKVKSPFVTIYPPFSSSTSLTHFPSSNHNTVVSVYEAFLFFFAQFPSPFQPAPQSPLPSDSCQSIFCIYESLSILCVCFVHE